MTIHRCLQRLLRRLLRALAIGGVAFSLAPATASARPERNPRDKAAQEQHMDWATITLAGGAVALLVLGALGMAAPDERRYLPTSN